MLQIECISSSSSKTKGCDNETSTKDNGRKKNLMIFQ